MYTYTKEGSYILCILYSYISKGKGKMHTLGWIVSQVSSGMLILEVTNLTLICTISYYTLPVEN